MRAEIAWTHGADHPDYEDRALALTLPDGAHLLGVIDGMGGMGRGAEASALAVQEIEAALADSGGFGPHRLRDALVRADGELRARLCESGDGLPGATAALVLITGRMAHVAWAGDCRATWLREGAVLARTADHKLAEDLVRSGAITREQADQSANAHVVTRALGGRRAAEAQVEPELLPHPWMLQEGDTLLLCSDGVTDLIAEEELAAATLGPRPAEGLVALARQRGAPDDSTVLALRWSLDRVQTEITPLPEGRTWPRWRPPRFAAGLLLGGLLGLGAGALLGAAISHAIPEEAP